MSSIPYVSGDALPDGAPTYTIDVVARGLRLSPAKVLQMVRDRQLLAIRRDGQLHIPQVFFGEADGRFVVAKHLTGLLSVLADGGYTPEDALRWLFAVQDDLEGGATPIDTLHTDHAREVIRRAQSLAF